MSVVAAAGYTALILFAASLCLMVGFVVVDEFQSRLGRTLVATTFAASVVLGILGVWSAVLT